MDDSSILMGAVVMNSAPMEGHVRKRAKMFTMYDSSISIVHSAFISPCHIISMPKLEHANDYSHYRYVTLVDGHPYFGLQDGRERMTAGELG